ncbi:MAG: hypothetical protein ABI352_00205 [Candidatus Dormibacter sp.]
MSDSRLGAPVELPWWVVPLALPPVLVIVGGVVLGAPLWAHLFAVGSSLAALCSLALVATRVSSASMQSVWISAAYAIWVFTAITWAVVVATAAACHCT